MRLPDQGGDRDRLTPSILMAVAGVSLFVLLILGLVLYLNREPERPKNPQPAVTTMPAIVDSSKEEATTPSKIRPDDLEFWNLFPEVTPTPIPEATPTPTPEAADPSQDGKHTLVINDDGSEEWVLITPYLPQNNFDTTRLVLQSGLMKYYEDGKQTSFVGVDVSKYDEYVDFNRLKRAGIDFVMIRVGARGYGSGQLMLDEYFADNLQRATEAGLQIGLYFFSQALSETEAKEEAQMILDQIGEYEILYPIAIDMEYVENDTARVEALNKTEKTAVTKAFLEKIQSAGYTGMIYGKKEWLIKKIDMSKLTAYDVWLSQIADIPDYPYKFGMWQYTVTGEVDGIPGYANLNISFINYAER